MTKKTHKRGQDVRIAREIFAVKTHDKEENLLYMILASSIRVNEELHSKQPNTLKFQFIRHKPNPAVTPSSQLIRPI
jgi:hypothetical protein